MQGVPEAKQRLQGKSAMTPWYAISSKSRLFLREVSEDILDDETGEGYYGLSTEVLGTALE